MLCLSKSVNKMIDYAEHVQERFTLEAEGKPAEEPRSLADWAMMMAAEMCWLYLVSIIGTVNRDGYSGDVVHPSFGGSMTIRFGTGFKLACSRRGVFLQVPVMGQVWVGRDEVVWGRVPQESEHKSAKTR